MVIVEACVNASIPYLLFKIFSAVECVRVRWVEDGTADSEVHVGSPEIAFQNTRDRARNTSVSGGIFRVIRGGAKGHPGWVGNRGRISVYAAVLNSRYRAPEAKVVLRVHATDEGVGDGGPQHGKKVCRVGGAERAPRRKGTKRSGILLRRLFGPEQANFSLLGSAYRAVNGT